MKTAILREAIEHMAAQPGIMACALVDAETCMVIQSAGEAADIDILAEAATDYWRLYKRLQKHFDHLGPLDTSVMLHAQGVINITPAANSVVVIALAQRLQTDWNAWQQEVRKLSELVQ
ncbi:MAG: hypothetical protein Q4G39_08635 [Brachymonas sp.]|nr:hypothetical protein [Brachymonas sp.]